MRLLPQLVTPAARAGLGLLLLLLVMLLLLLLVLLLLQAALASQSLSDAASRVRVFHRVAHTAGAANLGNVDEDLDAADSSNRWGGVRMVFSVRVAVSIVTCHVPVSTKVPSQTRGATSKTRPKLLK